VVSAKDSRRKPIWDRRRKTYIPFALASVVVIAIFLVVGSGALIWYGTPLDDRRPIAAGVLGVASGFILLLWSVPQIQVSDLQDLGVKERIELRDKTRATLAQVLGGMVLLLGIFTAVETLRSNKEAEFTDRLLRCVQLLGVEAKDGKKQIDSRIGAIHALGQISRDSGQHQRVVMDILAAYVQTNALRTQSLSSAVLVGADVQAAINLLVERDISYDPPNAWLDMSDCSLIQSDFTAGANVFDAKRGSVRQLGRMRFVASNLDGAFLVGVDLSHAIFKSTSMKRAFLGRTVVDRADLSNADLTLADLTGASLVGTDLSDAKLTLSKLYDADLTDAKVSQDQINSAVGNLATKLPSGKVRPSSWSIP
jgi:uncharacterized protein YjbI with pentapeptide repeats